MKEKKRSVTDYLNQENDDIRTIPDFYDNLFPSAEPSAENSIIERYKNLKSRKNKQNNEK